MIENMAKHMLVINDQAYLEILNFLDAADYYGKAITTSFNVLAEKTEKATVSYEARILKRMLLRLRE